MDGKSGGWQEKKQGKKHIWKKGDLRSSPTHQMPKEGATDPPLISLSNQFQAISDTSPSLGEGIGGEVPEAAVTPEPAGDAEPPSPGENMSSGVEAGLESKDKVGGEMDTSVSLKRSNPSDGQDGMGSGKKKAI